MTSRGNIKNLLSEYGLRPHKKFGQNFLVNPELVNKIIGLSNVSRDDIIIEIGVGLGALTMPLADKALKVIGIEVDKGILRFHKEADDLPENVNLVEQDVLKTDFHSLCAKYGKLKYLQTSKELNYGRQVKSLNL